MSKLSDKKHSPKSESDSSVLCPHKWRTWQNFSGPTHHLASVKAKLKCNYLCWDFRFPPDSKGNVRPTRGTQQGDSSVRGKLLFYFSSPILPISSLFCLVFTRHWSTWKSTLKVKNTVTPSCAQNKIKERETTRALSRSCLILLNGNNFSGRQH